MDEAIHLLAKDWQSSGINCGDTILIHSNLKRTLLRTRKKYPEFKPEDVLKSFIEALGPDGTLLLPLFNFNFPVSKYFNILATPSQMGALTEIGRLHPASVRTGHPIYSFAVIGKNAHLFDEMDNRSGYGGDSPFALLKELNGKIGVLDLEDQHSMTFYHHVEEMNDVSYRYFKDFSGTYIDKNGISTERSYQLFVRDLKKSVVTHVNPAGELMWENGLYQGNKPLEGNGLRTVCANSMFDFVTSIITAGNALNTLYRIGS
ncbi:AAC(3) family N-acetyltransferase [Terasakiella sp.]|uniref:AAC(3) family N-acetyltransferase n=1 Tax=Terasakiella sp. TaxID=2034861 RepID=UPI003AA95F6C